ncbi:MAG: hypothetical protein AABZ47_04695 [Planctomycetota bacterium]
MFSSRHIPKVACVLFLLATRQGFAQSSSSVLIWGDFSQSNVPIPNTGFVAIATGEFHHLGLKTDGSIVAWGQNNDNQISVPSPNTQFVAIGTGTSHSLGLKSNGSVVAWGRNSSGQCNVPAPNSNFIVVDGGKEHSLGLKSDGSIVAWGSSSNNVLEIPVPNRDFVAIAVGKYHNLGLKANGSIVTWGYNDNGQCNVPSPNQDFIAVAAGARHSLGLKTNGSIVAWGHNANGQISVPTPNSGFVHMAAGGLHSIGIRDLRTCLKPSDCEDGLDCTIDMCSLPASLCTHVPDHGFCADSVFCNGSDRCDLVRDCETIPRDCDDYVTCTIDSCVGSSDSCIHTPDDRVCDTYCLETLYCDPVTDCVCRVGIPLFVAADAPAGGDGSSWSTAFRELQDALAVPMIGRPHEIRVAKGVYRPSSLGTSASFQLLNGVEIKGGYAGPSTPNPDYRNPKRFETILSGDMPNQDSRHVVNGSGTDHTAILDGFTIKNGYGVGAGIYINQGGPTIRNCRIRENYGQPYFSGDDAAGVYCRGPALFENCMIENNEAGRGEIEHGGSCGGIGAYNGAVLDGCTVRNNRAGGGDTFCEAGTCHVSSPGNGGGICADSSVVIRNCLIVGNGAGSAGAGSCAPHPGDDYPCGFVYGTGNGIYGNPTITNCTIVGNSFGRSAVDGSARVSSSIVWGNGVTLADQVAGGAVIDHSDIQGWNLGPQDGNFAVDPLFVSGPLGDYYLSQESAGQSSDSPCVDAGNDLAATLGLDLLTTRTDTVGDNGMIDLGYHHPPDCGMDFSKCDGTIDLRTFADFQNCFMVDDEESYSYRCFEFDADANTLVDGDDYNDFLTLFLNEP